MNRKERRLALFTLLSNKARNNQVKVIENPQLDQSKTKDALKIMQNMGALNSLFAMLPNDRSLYLAVRNLQSVKPI